VVVYVRRPVSDRSSYGIQELQFATVTSAFVI
jgi:hypothetical protein